MHNYLQLVFKHKSQKCIKPITNCCIAKFTNTHYKICVDYQKQSNSFDFRYFKRYIYLNTLTLFYTGTYVFQVEQLTEFQFSWRKNYLIL